MADHRPVLGRETAYPDQYDPGLLVAIPRAEGRRALNLPDHFCGVDLWTAYELSWLTASGKPAVAIAEFSVDCHSPNIVESKSLKLYLNSLNQRRFDSETALRNVVAADLSREFGGDVAVSLYSPDAYGEGGITPLPGECLDSLEVACDRYRRDEGLLELEAGAGETSEQLYSHLLKTNCPVTGQPDWASISIDYRGPKIRRESLLRYLVSYRQHQDFHENCVETIFCDILHHCRARELTVYARFTRRGGLDINPWRSTERGKPARGRLARQ